MRDNGIKTGNYNPKTFNLFEVLKENKTKKIKSEKK
jgi:hypothetical protein